MIFYCEVNLLKKFLLPFFAILLGLTPLAAQEEIEDTRPVYTLGDQVFSFSAGVIVPLFTTDRYGNFFNLGEKLSWGGVGNLEWNGYLRKDMRLGVQLSGMFAVSPNKRTLSMVPLTAKFTYVLGLQRWSIPFYFGAGVSFNKLGSLVEFTPILKPGLGLQRSLNNNWELGANIIYWWVPELHIKDLAPQIRMGNFLEVSVNAVYHF